MYVAGRRYMRKYDSSNATLMKNYFFGYGFREGEEITPQWEETQGILRSLTTNFVYALGDNNFKKAYVVDALAGATDSLGVDVATVVRDFVAADWEKPIVCKDIVNPYQIPAVIHEDIEEKCWMFGVDEDKRRNRLLEDERYLIAIMNSVEEVKMFLYRK